MVEEAGFEPAMHGSEPCALPLGNPSMVSEVGIEPTLLSEADFESAASALFRHSDK